MLAPETFSIANPGPVCLIIDLWLPGLDGLELQSLLADRDEQLVFLTGHGDVSLCAKAMKAGAVDFLTKPADDEILLAAVTRALDRSRDIGRRRTEQAAARALLETLTARELQVMRCVVAGLLNKQIAAKLGIAEKTVKIHRGRVMRKTQSISVPDLMRLGLKADATENPPACPLLYQPEATCRSRNRTPNKTTAHGLREFSACPASR